MKIPKNLIHKIFRSHEFEYCGPIHTLSHKFHLYICQCGKVKLNKYRFDYSFPKTLYGKWYFVLLARKFGEKIVSDDITPNSHYKTTAYKFWGKIYVTGCEVIKCGICKGKGYVIIAPGTDTHSPTFKDCGCRTAKRD